MLQNIQVQKQVIFKLPPYLQQTLFKNNQITQRGPPPDCPYNQRGLSGGTQEKAFSMMGKLCMLSGVPWRKGRMKTVLNRSFHI